MIKKNKPYFISYNSVNNNSYNFYYPNVESNQNLKKLIEFTGISFYILNRKIIEKLLYITPITYQIDIAIGKYNSLINQELFYFNDLSVSNYNNISSVQYYFIDYKKFKKLLSKFLPEDTINHIYSFLPNKQKIIKNSLNY